MRRIVPSLAVGAVVILSGWLLSHTPVAHAITADEVLGEFSGLANQTGNCNDAPPDQRAECERTRRVGQAACLAQDFLNSIDSYYRNWRGEISRLGNMIFQDALSKIQNYAFCLIDSFGVFGNSYSLGTECTFDFKNDVKQYFEQDLKKKLVDDLKSRAMARCVMDQTDDGIRRAINENGREGATTWVGNYMDVYDDAKVRGELIAKNDFANTKYCPWLQREMEAFMGFSPKDAKPIKENVDSGAEPYTQRAACTFTDNISSEEMATNPQFTWLLTLPQNNIFGSYLMAQEHVQDVVNRTVLADQTQLLANNGYFGVERCEERDPKTGTCLRWVTLTPGSQLDNADQAAIQAQLDWNAQAKESNQLLGDATSRVLHRLLDSTISGIDFQFELDPSSRDVRLELPTEGPPPPPSAEPPPPPGTPGSPGGPGGPQPGPITDPGDPGQTDPTYCGLPNPDTCVCWAATEDPQYQSRQDLARTLLGAAIGRAARQNSGPISDTSTLTYESAPGSGIFFARTGKWVQFINAVCFELGDTFRGCRAYTPRAEDVIIIPVVGLGDLFVDIIRSDGRIRNPAMTAKYVCPSGVVP